MSDTLIKVEGLSKKFCSSLKRSMLYGTSDVMRDFIGYPYTAENLRKKEFWALQDINFELKRGESLGLIGQNGCGKTTLLRLINGIFPPDKGKITINGRIGALIAVGAGFHPHMTGQENIFLNGTILGMTKVEIRQKFDEIIDFAEIGDFINSPVATYSSGMTVRLGFAIAIHCDPDILLIDEILAVGDMKFQQKCFAKFGELMKTGVSIILVSHQILNIQKICNKALLLDKGKVDLYGESMDVINKYHFSMSNSDMLLKEKDDAKMISSFNIACKQIKFYNSKKEETKEFYTGEDIIVEYSFDLDFVLKDVSVHFSMSDSIQTYNGYSTYYDNIKIAELSKDTIIQLTIKNVVLSPGIYSASIGIWDDKFIGSYFWDYEKTGNIKIISKKKIQGSFEFEHKWEIK